MVEAGAAGNVPLPVEAGVASSKINYELKMVIMLTAVVGYNIIILHTHASVLDEYSKFLYKTEVLERPGVLKDLKTMGSVSLFIFFITLLVLARQNEYYCRLDFLWKNKFKKECEEIETMENLNRVLLENVLPAHVAEHFLARNWKNEDLYHQSYDFVCVMFASIPDFKEFYTESDVNKEGLECLRLLNEIIADFDELLSKPKFSGVEKIKTIGSTYMAATGLNATSGPEYLQEHDRQYMHIGTMVEFAFAIVAKLDVINKHSFNDFKLRNEYYCRLDFLWKNKFKKECEEIETMENLNRVLLENVLPAHVAEHFLARNWKNEDLYHQSYDFVCVMFASIPDFKEFYTESDVNKEGLECLRLLNEIIADFDELLSKPKFSGVEKIKTIGSTYMAATGLNATSGPEYLQEHDRQYMHIGTMVEFAFAIVAKLDVINKHSFNDFKLRVGINHGPVIAGVIGAQKPQYDIWGNTVNVASRMDSTGVLGKIQVTEETSKILQTLGYMCTCRGIINVKGKGELKTYYVHTEMTRSLSQGNVMP
ncbi:UNVERIFIED_CONTAM: hypothetical protein FKN15_072617 [Acipenser sinensis]